MKKARKVLAVILALLTLLGLLSVVVLAEQKNDTSASMVIRTEDDLRKACKVGGTYDLLQTVKVSGTLRVKNGVDLTINGAEEDSIIEFDSSKKEKTLFRVSKNAVFTINHVSLMSAERDDESILIYNLGDLYVNGSDAVLSNSGTAIINYGFAGLSKTDIRFNNKGILNYGTLYSTSDKIEENSIGFINNGNADLYDTSVAYNDSKIENNAILKNNA